MTKIIKWWKRFAFWNKVRGLIVGVVAVIEGSAYYADFGDDVMKATVLFLGVIVFAITYLVKDENNNNIVDAFESDDDNSTD